MTIKIPAVIFPPNVLTFYLTPHNPDGTPAQARTEIVIRDAVTTLYDIQQYFRSLPHDEQIVYLQSLITERLTS